MFSKKSLVAVVMIFLGVTACHKTASAPVIVRGNHDRTLDRVVRANPELVESYDNYKEIKIGEQRLVLFHFPILSWHQVHYSAWHLHGHCHGQLEFDGGAMMDVGVDAQNYRPIEFGEVRKILENKQPRYFDHHKEKKAQEYS